MSVEDIEPNETHGASGDQARPARGRGSWPLPGDYANVVSFEEVLAGRAASPPDPDTPSGGAEDTAAAEDSPAEATSDRRPAGGADP